MVRSDSVKSRSELSETTICSFCHDAHSMWIVEPQSCIG